MESESKPPTRTIIIITTMLGCVTFLKGAAASQFGASLVHLAYMYNSDIAEMSLTFAVMAVGVVAGSTACGFVYDTVLSGEFIAYFSCGLTGVITVILPWLPNVYYFYVAAGFRSICRGLQVSAVQFYLISNWGGSRYKPLVLQLKTMLNTLGGAVSPLVVSIFLTELPTSNNNGNKFNDILTETSTTNYTLVNVKYQTEYIANQITFPFAITGVTIMALSGLCMAVTLFAKHFGKSNPSVNVYKKVKQDKNESKKNFTVTVMSVVMVFLTFGTQSILGDLAAAYVTKGLHWPVQTGPQITSLFLTARTLGSLLTAFFSMRVAITNIIVAQLILTVSGYVMTVYGLEVMVWSGVFLAGFGSCCTYSTFVAWISDRVPVSAKQSSVFTVSSLIGKSAGTSFAGFLFEEYSHQWVIYLGILSSCSQFLVFASIYLYLKLCYTIVKG